MFPNSNFEIAAADSASSASWRTSCARVLRDEKRPLAYSLAALTRMLAEVQSGRAGKGPTTVDDFLNGYDLPPGTLLGSIQE